MRNVAAEAKLAYPRLAPDAVHERAARSRAALETCALCPGDSRVRRLAGKVATRETVRHADVGRRHPRPPAIA